MAEPENLFGLDEASTAGLEAFDLGENRQETDELASILEHRRLLEVFGIPHLVSTRSGFGAIFVRPEDYRKARSFIDRSLERVNG